MSEFYIPLMSDPIQKDDILAVKAFLDEDNIPRLSNGPQIEAAERDFANWLGCKYAVGVHSGSAANLLTIKALKRKFGKCSGVVPPLTWVSDWAALLHNGIDIVTCDINMKNLSFDIEKLRKAIRPDTKFIFLTHVLGLNAITPELLELCEEKGLLLIEDCCETVGATYKGTKVGNFGFAANWSGFVAHHFSGIEFGLITTNDEELYETCRFLRSHSMNREIKSDEIRQKNIDSFPELNKDFIFLDYGFNARSTEISGVLIQSQIKKLDRNNDIRKAHFEYFMKNLDGNKYVTDLNIEGQCAYSFIIILKEHNKEKWAKVEKAFREHRIEFRRGLSGGGSQIKQPYAQGLVDIKDEDLKTINHIHDCSAYVGLFPTLEKHKITNLLRILNSIDI